MRRVDFCNNHKTLIMLFKKSTLALTLIGLVAFGMTNFVKAQNTPPKNIIVFISDGWGINHIKATNYWHGVSKASFEDFPAMYYMSTFQGTQVNPQANPPISGFGTGYNSTKAWTDANFVNQDYTDSAPAATTMASGKKSANGAIGVDVFAQNVELITERSNALGKSSGVVTSVEWTHATPAGYATHNVSRNNYSQLALTMLLDSKLSVIMGCGHPLYDDNSNLESSGINYQYVGGKATWDTLVAGSNHFSIASLSGRTTPMDITGDGVSDPWTLIQDSIDFVNLISASVNPATRIVGTAKCYTTLNQNRTNVSSLPFGDPMNDEIPSLAQMTLGAINVLNANPNGFTVMIEGGAVDWAGHANQKDRVIEEQTDFNEAVDAIIAWVEANGGWEENLVIVTGDHETGYLTGPNYPGTDLVANYDIVNMGAGVLPNMKFNSGNHTNALIPLYAKGKGSERFASYADEIDFKFGYYIDNTELGMVCMDLFNNQPLPTPKNIIYMISDGMGYNHLKASNLFEGISNQVYETQMGLADFVHVAMSTNVGKTTNAVTGSTGVVGDYDSWYNSKQAWSDSTFVKFKPTDSAPAATSMFTGKKTANNIIGMDYKASPLVNFADRAVETGKAAGCISSVQFSHATPAALGAHNISRNNYVQIANEMILNSKFSVIMGCGAPDFTDNGTPKTPTNYNYVGGLSTWNELLAGGVTNFTASVNGNSTAQDINNDGNPDPWTLIRDSIDFVNLGSGKTPLRVLGIPKVSSTLQQGRTRTGTPNAYDIPFNTNVPTLTDMTKATLNILDNNSNGFAVMIEGGAIDWAGHANQMDRVIEEQDDFNNSVQAVIAWVNANSNWDETLLIITADHECGYLVGPSFANNNAINTYDITANGAGNLPSGQFISTDHTNQLVPLYAHGAGASVIAEYATQHDKAKGRYLQNTEPVQAIFKMWDNLTTGSPVINNGSIENTWTGFADNNWHNPANWSNFAIPDYTTDVILPTGLINYPSISSQAYCNNILLENNASIIGNESLTINGTARVERLMEGNMAYHFLSSPVVSTKFGDIFPQNQSNIWIRRYDEPSGNWVNMDASEKMKKGKGYSFYMEIPSTTAGFEGKLNRGIYDSAFCTNYGSSGNLNFDGWNLVGNPYPSAIDWDHPELIKTGLDNQIAIWSALDGNYRYWNGSTGSITNGIIPSTQGFFVKANMANAQLLFTPQCRIHSNQPYYKSANNQSIGLEITSTFNSYRDATYIQHVEGATNKFESSFDAFKLPGLETAPELYTMDGQYKLSINALDLSQASTIPVYFRPGADATYHITAKGMETIPGNEPIWLEDLKAGIRQNLRQNAEYSFASSKEDELGRFKLTLGTVGVEGVEMSGIEVLAMNSAIRVTTPANFEGAIYVYDLLGKLVAEKKGVNAGLTSINMNVAHATYLVKVVSAQYSITRKVFIN